MGLRRRKPLRADPEKVREWQRRSRRNNRLKRTRLKRSGGGCECCGRGQWTGDPEKRKKEWERAYGSEERVRWVQRQPCVACGETPCENAHISTGGTGRKADADKIVPLCWDHHQEAHQFGHETLEDRYDLDLVEEARETDRRWKEVRGMSEAAET